MLNYETAQTLYTEMKLRAMEKAQGPFGEFYKILKSNISNTSILPNSKITFPTFFVRFLLTNYRGG